MDSSVPLVSFSLAHSPFGGTRTDARGTKEDELPSGCPDALGARSKEACHFLRRRFGVFFEDASRAARQISEGSCRAVVFLKRARTSPGQGTRLHARGPHPPFIQRLRLIGRRRAEVRSLLSALFSAWRLLAIRRTPPTRARPSHVAEFEQPSSDSRAPCKGGNSAPFPIGALTNLLPPSRDGHQWGMAPAECVEKPSAK
jgi:hypothetical protein